MPVETTAAAGGALIKIFGVPVLAGIIATSIGFIFMWPKSIKEGFFRIVCTISTSTIFGPALVIALRSWWPNLFEAAKEIALLYGTEPAFGFLFIAAPLMVIAGLPAWWLIGGVFRWLDNRKEKDIGELMSDAANAVKTMRGTL